MPPLTTGVDVSDPNPAPALRRRKRQRGLSARTVELSIALDLAARVLERSAFDSGHGSAAARTSGAGPADTAIPVAAAAVTTATAATG